MNLLVYFYKFLFRAKISNKYKIYFFLISEAFMELHEFSKKVLVKA